MTDKESLPVEKPTRQELFIRNLFISPTVNQAAIQAGYSESYANTVLYTRMKNKAFKDKIREYAIDNDILALPKIAYLETTAIDNAITEAQADKTTAIDNLSKLKHVTKQKKQIAGILSPDSVPQQVTYNFTSAQDMMIQIQGDKLDNKDVAVDLTPMDSGFTNEK